MLQVILENGSDLKWMKVESNGGRKERKIELGMRFGREKEQDHTMNAVIQTKERFHLSKTCLFSDKFPLQ